MTERIGIIDLGSNSSRLSIFEVNTNNSYRPVFEMKQNVRLARNMTADQKISADGIARAVSCTKLFYHAGTLHGVTHWIPVATAAIRQASNRNEILGTLETETNIDFRVLSGEEEGRYGYLGVVNTLSIQDALLFDIGGASSELMYVRDRQLVEVVSLPFGALNLTELFRQHPDKEAGNQVRNFMQAQFAAIPWLQQCQGLPMVGLGGTARALAKLDLWRQQQRFERVHGYPVHPDAVLPAFEHIRSIPAPKRRKIKGLSNTRADILVAGLATIVALIDTMQGTEVVISRNGLREGIFYEYLLRNHREPVVDNVLEHSLSNFQKVFHVNKQVASVVTDAALKLFDALIPIHNLDSEARQLLRVTAQIESCGCYVNTEKWTLHSAYLAVASILYGPTYPQLLDIANLLNGKGELRLQKLYTLIRLAKLLTLQLGLVPDVIHCDVSAKQVVVGRAERIVDIVRASSEADLAHTFHDMFGMDLVYADFSGRGA